MTASVEPELPSTGHGKVLRLPPDVHRLRDARRFVCETLAEWEAAPPQDAVLMTTELVSNAMLHAGGDVAVRVRRDGARALVEVHDKALNGRRFSRSIPTGRAATACASSMPWLATGA